MLSASSSRTTVVRVKGRRPDSAFSRVERLTLAWSASHWRESRRRASSSRTCSTIRSLPSTSTSPRTTHAPAAGLCAHFRTFRQHSATQRYDGGGEDGHLPLLLV